MIRDEQFSEEMAEHISALTDENIRAGMSPTEARRQAILKFGPTEAIKESYRGQQGLPILESVLWETRYALRRLRMAPAFTIATVLTLALGLGATTSIFTLVHAILLRSLPVARPDELYRLGKESRCCYTGGYSQEKEFSIVSYDLYKYLGQYPGLFGTSGLPCAYGPVWCPSRRSAELAPQPRRRVCLGQLFFCVRH